MVVKYGDALIPQRLVAMLPHGAVLAMSLLATAACTAVAAFQLLATRLIGALTLSQPFTVQIVLLKRTYLPRRDRLVARPAALRTLPAGQGRSLVHGHRRRAHDNGTPLLPGDAEPLSFQKVSICIGFVPLHRGNIPDQPVVAACG